MKTKFTLRLQAIWQTLTEVPGWPDAPISVRIRRVLPITIPAVAFVLALIWNFAWVRPRVEAERAAHAGILDLVAEVEALREVSPEADAAAVAMEAQEASKSLLSDKAALPAELEKLRQLAQQHGWDATFQTVPVVPEDMPQGTLITFLQARGRLSPLAGNADPYPSLITLLERVSAGTKRIDLTRLAVRADEKGRHSVEVSLRVGCQPPS